MFFHDSLFCKVYILVLVITRINECHMVEVNFINRVLPCFRYMPRNCCMYRRQKSWEEQGMRLGEVSIGSKMKPITTILMKPYAIQV